MEFLLSTLILTNQRKADQFNEVNILSYWSTLALWLRKELRWFKHKFYLLHPEKHEEKKETEKYIYMRFGDSSKQFDTK